jgi:hypothetical protein
MLSKNIIREELIYYNKKMEQLYNLYEERSYALDLYNTAIEKSEPEEIVITKIYLETIEKKLILLQDETLILDKLNKMIIK